MPTNEQFTLTKPGTHFLSPVTAVLVRTSDPAAPASGFMLYPFLNTVTGLVEARIIFAGGTAQVIASST